MPFLNERILKHFTEFRVKFKRKFNDEEAKMCSTGGCIKKGAALKEIYSITWAATERARRAASFTFVHPWFGIQCTNQTFWATKDRFDNVITIIFFFAINLLRNRQPCYSGALRPRDYRRRALVCLGSYANEPTSCSEEVLNYLDAKYDRVPNDPVGLSDI